MLDRTCEDNQGSKRKLCSGRAAVGLCLGTLVLITRVSPSSGWGGYLDCPLAEGSRANIAAQRPEFEDRGGAQMLVDSCADNWSFQLLDDSLVRIARVSSCSRTLEHITNCPKPRALGPGIQGRNSVQMIRVVSCSVHQRTYENSCIQFPAPRTLVWMLIELSCADNWNA